VEDAIHAGVTAYTINAEGILMAHIRHPPRTDQTSIVQRSFVPEQTVSPEGGALASVFVA
jgi:hypothetical protein